jgi:hypothetical protein
VDTAEITFYVQAYKADSPQFSAPWTPSDPNIEFVVKEELPPSSVLFKLIAMDPITNEPVRNVHFYMKLELNRYKNYSLSTKLANNNKPQLFSNFR